MSQLIGTDPDVDQELATSASASPAARRWPRLLFSRRLLAAGAGLAVLVGAVAILRSGGHRPSTTAKAATSTATVAARDLVNREQVNGTLGYAALPAALVASQPGVLTALAAEGAVVGRGQQLFVVDTQPVVVLFGPMPAYRDLVEGMSGADVRQLKENLVTLGHATWPSIGDNDEFSAATAAALRRYQRAIGAAETGIVRQGDVVFLPGAVRIATHKLDVGAAVTAGAQVTDISSATRVVTVKLDSAKQGLVKVGDSVVIELPSGKTTPGIVSAIATVARQAAASGAPGSDPGTTVDVTVELSDPAATGTIDQAPVKVDITTSKATGVLAVPVNALVALAEGGYGVEVVRADGTHQLVGVTIGMFSDADSLVEVSGGDLKAGDNVVVSG